MNASVLLRGGDVVSSTEIRRADVLIQDGVVTAVESSIAVSPGTPVCDVEGRLILPGLVDPHAHVGLTLGSHTMVDDFAGVTRAAAKGGVTTIVDFAQTVAGASLAAAVDAKREAADNACMVDFALHALVNDTSSSTLAEIPGLVAAGVAGFKVFTAYRSAGMMLEDDQIVKLCAALADAGALLAVHAENEAICVAGTAEELAAGNVDVRAHARSRPMHAEVEAVRRAIYWTGRAHVPLYVVHVTTGDALRAIDEARAIGMSAYAETCPHYLTFDDKALDRSDAITLLMTPPLRPAAERDELWRGLRRGTVHAVGSDEASWRLEDKRQAPGFADAPNGIPGVEARLPLIWTLGVERGRLTPCDVVRVCSEQPARLMGLAPRKGSLVPGSDGDVVVVDPNRSDVLGPRFRSSSLDWSPYDGILVRGAPEHVYLRGRAVVEGGHLISEKPDGRFQHRKNDQGLLDGPLFL